MSQEACQCKKRARLACELSVMDARYLRACWVVLVRVLVVLVQSPRVTRSVLIVLGRRTSVVPRSVVSCRDLQRTDADQIEREPARSARPARGKPITTRLTRPLGWRNTSHRPARGWLRPSALQQTPCQLARNVPTSKERAN
jgi:hypothetical protein